MPLGHATQTEEAPMNAGEHAHYLLLTVMQAVFEEARVVIKES